MADDLSSDLNIQGIPVQSLHGDRRQCDRDQSIRGLGNWRVKILIATDLASRGLDGTDVTHVYNYNFPAILKNMYTELDVLEEQGKQVNQSLL